MHSAQRPMTTDRKKGFNLGMSCVPAASKYLQKLVFERVHAGWFYVRRTYSYIPFSGRGTFCVNSEIGRAARSGERTNQANHTRPDRLGGGEGKKKEAPRQMVERASETPASRRTDRTAGRQYHNHACTRTRSH